MEPQLAGRGKKYRPNANAFFFQMAPNYHCLTVQRKNLALHKPVIVASHFVLLYKNKNLKKLLQEYFSWLIDR
jgi:hypothetical protein